MTRSPFSYPFGRALDSDGMSELQTDVMRFIAILALCLVAIFALVQSIPLAPVAVAPPATPVAHTPEPETVAVREVVLDRPAPPAAPPPEAPPVEREGFTLRFEDEHALTRLVARNEVGLYAILADQSYRMNVNGGQMSFWPASLPKRFHEMDELTVPKPVVDSFRRSGAQAGKKPTWGVTIPAATSQEIEQYLHDAKGGELIIDAAGKLRLEP